MPYNAWHGPLPQLLVGAWFFFLVTPSTVLGQRGALGPPLPDLAETEIRVGLENGDNEESQPASAGMRKDATDLKKETQAGGKDQPPSIFASVPPIQALPRLGNFIILPTGPGYYSLLDVVRGNYREKPPNYPYSPIGLIPSSYFNSDLRYLDRPDNDQFDFTDVTKRVMLGEDWMVTAGGAFRYRYMDEQNSRLTGFNNEYNLYRTRVFGDIWFRNLFRFYVEYIDGASAGEELRPLAIDVNRSDLLNCFIDVNLCPFDDHPFYFRAGRQELLFGSQRLISPLNWANTRRTFEGLKLFRVGEQWDIDLFWVRPVVIHPTSFDEGDTGRDFSGVWVTHRPRKGVFLDMYFLNLNQQDPDVAGRGGAMGGYNVSTIGSRYAGAWHNFLWDVEGMYQFGDRVNQTISAGACTVGLGYHFAGLPMNPQLWVYKDWASGDSQPGFGDTYGTFNQMFPFGHWYFGFLDLVGRQNIDDLNTQLALFPVKWLTVLLQYHHFQLSSARDALYGAGGAPLRRDPTGQAGRDVGDEFDLFLNFHLDAHQDLIFGYSKLAAGEFLQRTGNPRSPELFYVQYSFRW